MNAGTLAGRGAALGSGASAGLRIFNGAGAGTNVTVAGDINNSGTISSETGAAILIENVNYTGTITNSGTLSGTSVLDASSALGAITFNQIGGAFNDDYIGSAFGDTLNISGSNFVLGGDILGGVNTTIEAATATTVAGARSISGDFTSNGTLNFGLGTDSLTIDGDTTLGANSTVNIATSNEAANLGLGQAINVITQSGAFANNGATVNLVDTDFLIDYTVNQAGNIIVTPQAANLANVSTDANVSALATGVTAALTAGTLGQAAFNSLNGSANAAAFEAAAISLLPSLNEGVSREIWESHSQSAGFITQRLENQSLNGAWIQGKIRSADRGNTSLSVSGYDADTTGFAIGYDRQVSDQLRLGVSYNFADIEIETDGVNTDTTELSTNQVSAYAGFNSGQKFANAQIGYIFGDADSSRVSSAGTVTGDFDVTGFTAQAFAGYDYGVFSPQIGVRYGSVSQDSFTESGGLGLNVDADSVNYFEGVIGASVSSNLGGTNGWAVKPTVRANYVYDFAGDARDVNITLPGATGQLLSSGDNANSRFELDGSFDLVSQSGMSIGIGYEGDFASGYSSHAGLIRARFGF